MSGDVKAKVPVIRFAGFDEEWKSYRLDEAATVDRGKFSARPRNDPKYFGGAIPFVQTGDIVSANRRLINFSQTLNEEGLVVSRLFPKNTVLITIAANIGDLAIADFSVACPDSVVAISAKDNFNNNFLYDFLGTKKADLEAAATTAAQANINLKVLNPLIIEAPTIAEQKKIGGFFSQLDASLSLYQNKLKRLNNLKQAMLQKMFPQGDAVVPEIRFQGFAGEWGKFFLNEACVFNPKSALPDVIKYVDLESVVGTKMLASKTMHTKEAPSRAQRLAQKGDLFFQTVRPYQKNNYLFTGEEKNFVFSTGYAQMRPFGDGYFLLSLVQKNEFVDQVLNNCTGTSYPAINSDTLGGLEIFMPCQKEQQRIGNYFRKLDELIALHQTQLEKLKQIKLGCLGGMFV